MRNIRIVIFELSILILILSLGLFLYLFRISRVPPGIYADEAVTGYNAYSILITGRDEFGKAFPVAMRFLGSYTPPLYTYLTAPIMAVLGLSVTSTRLLSAISGLLGIVLIFLFLKTLKITSSASAPFIGSLLFAIAPWTVFFSRAGYEMNLAFFVFSLSALLIWLGMKKPFFLAFGFPILSLATYADYTQRLLAPFFLVLLFLFFYKELFTRKNIKFLLVGLFVGMLIQLPNLTIITTPAFFIKANRFYTEAILNQAEKISHFLPMFVAVPLAFLWEFLSKFFSYFSPRSLFFLPDPDPQRSLPQLSVFYVWMIVPYLVGLYFLFKERKGLPFKFLIFLAIVSTIPAALTGDPFHVQRALPLLLPLILIITLGMDKLINRQHFLFWFPIFLLLIAGSLVLLMRSYFVFLPKERAKVWGYGFAQLAQEIREHPNEKFIIDQPKRIRPEFTAYIQLAFFLKIPPEEVQAAASPAIKNNYYTNTQFDPKYKFANVETKPIEWGKDDCKEQILVGDELSISEEQAKEHSLTKVFEVRDPIGQLVFLGFKTDPQRKCGNVLD